MADDPTLDFYARNAAEYVQHGAGEPRAQLVALMAALPSGARVLELGSGSGRDAAAMLERGFDVDATDASPELAAEGARRIGRPVRIMRFDQLDAVEAYDAV